MKHANTREMWDLIIRDAEEMCAALYTDYEGPAWVMWVEVVEDAKGRTCYVAAEQSQWSEPTLRSSFDPNEYEIWGVVENMAHAKEWAIGDARRVLQQEPRMGRIVRTALPAWAKAEAPTTADCYAVFVDGPLFAHVAKGEK